MTSVCQSVYQQLASFVYRVLHNRTCQLGYDKAILVVKAIVLDTLIFHIRNGLSSELLQRFCKIL